MTDLRVTVAVPLDAVLVKRIRAIPGIEVAYAPDLLPPPRFPGDHAGVTGFVRDADGEARWQAMLEGTEISYGVPGDTPAGLAALLDVAPRLRWVQGTAAGAGEQARRAGLSTADVERVAVTTAAGVHGPSLAEFAVFGLLAGAKELDRLVVDQAAHVWPVRRPVRQLAGRRVLVLGLGGIGAETARLAAALGMVVTGVRRRVDTAPVPGVTRVLSTTELPAAFDATDDVVLALPGTIETEAVVDGDLLNRLPADATIVNVGRGSALDEAALVAALDTAPGRYAVLDVTAVEPLPPDSVLWDNPRVLISPHTAALTAQEDERIVALFCDNLARFVEGAPLRNRVRGGTWY